MNKFVGIGRLVADVELRSTNSGKSVCAFTVAINRRGKDAGTDWVDCVAWEKTAEFISKHFNKGQQIAITGRLQTRSYEDKNGGKRKAVEVVVEEVDFCGSKPEGTLTPSGFQALPADDEGLPF